MKTKPIYYPPQMEVEGFLEDIEVLCTSTITEDGDLPGVTPGFDQWD